MSDPPISTTTVGAAVLWVAAFVLAGVYAFVGIRGMGVFAVLFMGGGATLTVRRYLFKLADDLIERERAAFELGRDSQRIKSVD